MYKDQLPMVKKNQIWCDGDYRRSEREFRVVRNPRNSAFVTIRNTFTGRTTLVRRERFDGSSRGYCFVR